MASAKEFRPRAIGLKIATKYGAIRETVSPESIRNGLTTRKAVLGSIAAEGVAFIATGTAGIFTGTADTASTALLAEGAALYLLSKGLRMDEQEADKQDYNCYSLTGIDNVILGKLDKIRPEKARNFAKRAATVLYIGTSRASLPESRPPDQKS